MSIAREISFDTKSGNKPIYRTSFVRHSHELLKMGYDLLASPKYAASEEEVITGELVRSRDEVGQLQMRRIGSRHTWPRGQNSPLRAS